MEKSSPAINGGLSEGEARLSHDERIRDAIVAEEEHLAQNCNWFSMMATCVSLMATWEALCSTMATGLISGGPVSLVYGYILAFIGTLATAVSLSECASMYPSAGGQYHYVAELSPPPVRRILSWVSGWITTFGWQSFAASAPFLAATMLQGLLVLNYPEYNYKRWHGTLLYWAILMLSMLVNIFTAKILPKLEIVTMIIHIVFFIVLLISMVVVAPGKNSAAFVFTEYINSSGWESNGVAWCIGMLSASYVLAGYDGATHLSEEMQDPATGVPKAMIDTPLINGALGFAFLLTILFTIQDIEAALQTTTGYPIIQIFYQITGSNAAAATAMTCTLIIMACLATVPLVASTARVTWAFARDSGLPFSQTISKVDHTHGIPSVAVIVTTIFLALLGLLNIATTSAFNAILSLAVIGLYISYILPIILLLHRRIINPQSLPWGKFKMGRVTGITVNLVSIIYTIFTSVFLLFPPYQPVTPLNFNYASVVLGAVVMLSVGYWFWSGRRNYDGPVIVLVQREVLSRSQTRNTYCEDQT